MGDEGMGCVVSLDGNGMLTLVFAVAFGAMGV